MPGVCPGGACGSFDLTDTLFGGSKTKKLTLEICQVMRRAILISSYMIWTRIGGKCFVEVR